MLKAKLFGDWSTAKAILGQSAQLKKAIHKAVLQEAQQARTDVVKGITAQAPGGQPFAALTEMTLAMRRARGFRGKKALIVSSSLRNSITVKQVASGKVFLGVLRTAKSKDGRSLVNVADVHENGRVVVIRVTPKMRMFLMVQLRKAGFATKEKTAGGRDKGGRFKKSKFVSSGTGQLSKGVIVVKIPARPFIGPVIKKIASNPAAMQRRLAHRIAVQMKMALGE